MKSFAAFSRSLARSLITVLGGVGIAFAPPVWAGELGTITSEQIDSLCTNVGSDGLALGSIHSGDIGTKVDFAGEAVSAGRAPFLEAWPSYTAWSDRLAKVEWYAAFEETVDPVDFLERMATVLGSGGWTPSELGLDSSRPEWRTLVFTKGETSDGRTAIRQIEVQAVPNLSFECSTAELAQLYEEEGQGILAPGSLRPQPPAIEERLPIDPASCETPEMQAILSTNGSFAEAGYSLEKIVPAEDPENKSKRYGERLRTWLVWKMIASGKIDHERIWQIEDAAAPDPEDDRAGLMLEFLENAGKFIDSGKAGDKITSCRLIFGMMAKQREIDAAAAARLQDINVALEAEARRLGIPLD